MFLKSLFPKRNSSFSSLVSQWLKENPLKTICSEGIRNFHQSEGSWMAQRIGNWLSTWPVHVLPRLQLATSCCSLTGCLMVSRKWVAVFIPVPNGQVSTSELATWLARSKSGQRTNCLWRINFPPACNACTCVGGEGAKWRCWRREGGFKSVNVSWLKPFGS